MLAGIKPPFSEEEKTLLQQVAAMDRLITGERSNFSKHSPICVCRNNGRHLSFDDTD
jgi:hypothetical protein